MTTKAEKKNTIRQGIIDAAMIYSSSLAGKTFLYVCGENFFEASKEKEVDNESVLLFSETSPCKCKKKDTMFKAAA